MMKICSFVCFDVIESYGLERFYIMIYVYCIMVINYCNKILW